MADTNKPFQFLNNFYFRAGYDENHKWQNDFMYIIYRDERDGQKKVVKMEEPSIEFFKTKKPLKKKVPYIKREKTKRYKCKFRYLTDYMAEVLGNDAVSLVENLKKSKKFSAIKKIHQNKNFFSSDIDITDYWKGKFLNSYEENTTKHKITKSYFDIEVDTIDHVGFPNEEEAPCPVNAITLVIAEQKLSFTFLLENKKNPQIEKLKANKKKFIKKIKKTFEESYEGFEYDLMFFDDELELITEFFNYVNDFQPDFSGGYNIKFDLNTLINRIIKLGGSPEEIICHSDFDIKKADYVHDHFHSAPEDRTDYFLCSSYTQYVDQYLMYCQIRKGMGKRDSYTLNSVAADEIGDTKLDYSDTGTISTLPYEDYEKFVLYNIKDVLLCYKLEETILDIEFIYKLSIITRTRLNKVMKKTISIKNLFNKFCQDNDYVLANNMNIRYVKDDNEVKQKKIEGAIVGNPFLNKHLGIWFNNIKSKFIFKHVIDFDLSSLYPSIIRCFNIAPHTQIGKIQFINPSEIIQVNLANVEHIEQQFADDLNTRDYLQIGTTYLGLPSITSMIEEIKQSKEEGSIAI